VSTSPTPSDPRADELLAVRCQLGERQAFDGLIARWHAPLWNYLRRMAGAEDVAADLMQDTWLRALRGINSLRDPSRLRPWLFGIARRVAMDRLRTLYARPVQDDVVLEDIAAPEFDAGLESDLAMLEAHLESLPARERETLVLFYLRELTIEEMALLLGVPAGTIKSRLFRARDLLRQKFQHPGVVP
jgi:RNA polymerase sigma-70 factor (ECF subfamily)